jgi:hypothetical protein
LQPSKRHDSERYAPAIRRTRGRSLAAIETTRQPVDGYWAVVHLKLTLKDGSVLRAAEPMVLHRSRWLLG